MRTFKLITGTLVLAMLVTLNCDSLLDTEPTASIDTEVALSDPANVSSVLIGAYDKLSSGNLYGGWALMLSDFLAESNEFSFTGTFFAPREIWSKSQLYDNGQASSTWIQAYDAINVANNVIDALDLIEDADEKDRIEGEAKFIRAAIYFELVRLYAPTYVAGGANAQAGVPLVLTPTTAINETSNVERATVAEVYTQILADLTTAKTLLDETNPVRAYYANSMVASAFLSRVHLQMGNFEGARDESSRVIESGNYELDPTPVSAFNHAENTDEDIFAMQVSGQDGTNSLYTFYSPDSRGDIEIDQDLLDEYEAGDARLFLFYEDPDLPGKIWSGKWNDGTDGNVGIVRIAEMYLTRAEANFRLGTDVGDTPLADVNAIRDRAGLPVFLLPTEITLAGILQERKLELVFEGVLLHDIKRTQGSVGARAYDDDKLVLPIPRREIDTNPNICQNESYTGPVCQ